MPKKPFVDFREVRSRITMENVLEHYGVLDTFKRTGDRLSGPCPIHGGTNPTQFRVDTEKNLWNCFSECKHGGNVLDFIAKKEDVSIHEAAIKGNSAPETEEHASPAPAAKPKPAPAARPEDNTPNPPLKFRLEKLNRAHPYFAERGISQEQLMALVRQHTEERQFLFLGEARVNVLELNLDLDSKFPVMKRASR